MRPAQSALVRLMTPTSGNGRSSSAARCARERSGSSSAGSRAARAPARPPPAAPPARPPREKRGSTGMRRASRVTMSSPSPMTSNMRCSTASTQWVLRWLAALRERADRAAARGAGGGSTVPKRPANWAEKEVPVYCMRGGGADVAAAPGDVRGGRGAAQQPAADQGERRPGPGAAAGRSTAIGPSRRAASGPAGCGAVPVAEEEANGPVDDGEPEPGHQPEREDPERRAAPSGSRIERGTSPLQWTWGSRGDAEEGQAEGAGHGQRRDPAHEGEQRRDRR